VAIFRLLLAYDGTDFHGWAAQPAVRTVEGVLAEALGRLLGEQPKLSVAGRTDAGVHALGQVASFHGPEGLDPERVKRALNGMLGPELVALAARRAPDGFDARRSATGREYRYRIDTGEVPSPLMARYVWHHPGGLHLGRMRAGARQLIGEHDFSSFCRAPQPPSSTLRTVRRLSVRAVGNVLELRVEANAFLHQMVRSMVGSLVAVGEGRIEPDAIPAILDARTRSAAGPVAPPHGLTLMSVRYGRRSLTRIDSGS
jgi:tRNA pseudouridine38-40 synthase